MLKQPMMERRLCGNKGEISGKLGITAVHLSEEIQFCFQRRCWVQWCQSHEWSRFWNIIQRELQKTQWEQGNFESGKWQMTDKGIIRLQEAIVQALREGSLLASRFTGLTPRFSGKGAQTRVHEEWSTENLHWKQGDNSWFSFFKQSDYCPSTNFNISGSEGEESACDAADLGSITGLGRSPGEGNGYPLQYSCLENSFSRGAWWATVHGVAESRTWLRDYQWNILEG